MLTVIKKKIGPYLCEISSDDIEIESDDSDYVYLKKSELEEMLRCMMEVTKCI